MKKFLIGLFFGLFIITGINASFFDSIVSSITGWKYVKNQSNQNIVYKTALYTLTGYSGTGIIQTGVTISCINCSGNNYFDGSTSIGTTLGTTVFTNGFGMSYGSGLAWNDIQNLQLRDTDTTIQKPTLTTISGSVIKTRCFDGGTQMNEIFGNVEIPHDFYNGTGSIISPHVHWLGSTTSATTGVFYFDYTIIKAGQIYSSTTTLTGIFYNITGRQRRIDELGVYIPATGLSLGDTISFRLSRTPTGIDTYAGLMCLTQVGFHYQIDSNGSRSEYVK